MGKLVSTLHRLGQFLTSIVEARLPLSAWLDSATLHLYRTRL